MVVDFEEGENVIMEVHRHPIVIAQSFLVTIVLLFVPFFLPFLVGHFIVISAATIAAFSSLAVFIYCIWALLLIIFFFISWTIYYLQVWYVTDRRIVDIDQVGFFSREVISFRYDNIQDITVDTKGILATTLKYGDIRIETASENQMIFLKTASRPDLVKNKILDIHHAALDTQNVKVVGQTETPPPPHDINVTSKE